MNGLIHISELTDSYVKMFTIMSESDKSLRKVLEINPETNNAKLSLKQAKNYYAYFKKSEKIKRKD